MNVSRTLGLAAFVLFASSATAVDWSKVDGKEVVLFYPGQAAWEWTLTQSDHSGNEKFRKGKDCRDCHQDEQNDIGSKIVKGEKLEPNPLPGRRPSIPMTVKAAHDGDRVYLRFEWPQFSGSMDKKLDPEVATRVTVMLDDGKVVEATRAGCWGTCHADLPDMARANEGEKLTKYLAASRTKITRDGGGDSYKSAGDLDKLLKDGVFMEFWQAQLNPGQAPKAVDGYVLDKRHVNDSPSISAEGGLEGDKWVVVLSRALKSPGPGHKDIVSGKTYTLGFAIHDAYANHRYHQVSLENTLVIDSGDADFVAKKM